MQDIHWFGGDFGYFPTYSIGAFIAAQIFDCIKKQNPKLEIDLKNGNFLPIINWLKKIFIATVIIIKLTNFY